MIRILPTVAILLAAACSQGEQAQSPPANNVADAAAAPEPKNVVPSLEGSWSVASVAGNPGGGLILTAGNGLASLSAGCLRRSFAYKQDRNLVSFTASPGGSSNCGQSTSADQEAAFGALADANMAIFGKEGTEATLSGPGGTLTLQRR